jgi:hypothetical protein
MSAVSILSVRCEDTAMATVGREKPVMTQSIAVGPIRLASVCSAPQVVCGHTLSAVPQLFSHDAA